jgi:hypothetical protein
MFPCMPIILYIILGNKPHDGLLKCTLILELLVDVNDDYICKSSRWKKLIYDLLKMAMLIAP